MAEYDFNRIEKEWRQKWANDEIYKAEQNSTKPKFYALDMFPYPSGAGLHVGHPLGYIASDIYSRYKRLKGYNVLHPMGFDAFGLPAEQYAIQTGKHPSITTEENIITYKNQLNNIGLSFDWSREVNTSDPKYYKWTQWIFSNMFNHYYCNKEEKAKPISLLEVEFEKEGNRNTTAFSDYDEVFDAQEWQSYSKTQKADVLMNYRLAFRKTSFVNWCEALGTVLANDEVVNGVSERGGHEVVQKPLLQWSLRITAYAERLLKGLKDLDWSDSLKLQQENWIGKSMGASVVFDVKDLSNKIEVFTTRPDTIFGVTFMVLAPEHPLLEKIVSESQGIDINNYQELVKSKSSIERQAGKDVTGVFTGAYAIHPFTKKEIPIWVSDYVLIDYGTGAIMAVPSDDERDRAFANKMDLDIIEICDKSKYPNAGPGDKVGIMQNSDFLDGMEVKQAIKAAINKIETEKLGEARTNYKLRDANFSRQRYWGEPFPIFYTEDGIAHTLPNESLPLELPVLDNIKPINGKSPLSKASDWTYNGHPLDTDTMPGNAGSSWYFLRYMDPNNDEEFCSPSALKYWQDVDLYIGGTEHAVGHLMYARFWHKFLYDLGYLPTQEPFKKLLNQGMIQGIIEMIYMQKEKVNGNIRFLCAGLAKQEPETEFVKIPLHIDFVNNYGLEDSYLNLESIKRFLDWRPEYKEAIFECSKGVYHKGKFTPKNNTEVDSHLITHSEIGKMSKSKFNVVNPDQVIDQYGADCFRMFEMFLGPIETAKPWNTKGIDGVAKFLRKFWNLFHSNDELNLSAEAATPEELKILHTCIKKVTEDVERFSFNTCISAFMICVNDLNDKKCNKSEVLKPLLIIMAPFAPYITDELWSQLGEPNHVHRAEWPAFNDKFLVESTKQYPVSINGKVRTTMEFALDTPKETMETEILSNEVVQKWLDGNPPKKVIIVPGKIINVVI